MSGVLRNSFFHWIFIGSCAEEMRNSFAHCSAYGLLLLLVVMTATSAGRGGYHDSPSRPQTDIHIFTLYIVVDSDSNQTDIEAIEKRIQSIFILTNKIYRPLNIQFQIAYIELWQTRVVDLSNEKYLVYELQQYKQRFANAHHDCFHAFISPKRSFTKLGYGEMLSMCSRSSCIGYTVDSAKVNIEDTVYVLSHELAHNFGVRHDTSDCKCSNCIMATGIEISSRSLLWSVCSVSQFQSLLNLGYPSCRPHSPHVYHPNLAQINDRWSKKKENVRKSIINISVCGNGIVETGEECDCGKSNKCSQCCDSFSCKLLWNARCSNGPCCNTSSCQLMESSTICRPTKNVCDFPEYCTGQHEKCQEDNYKQDGTPCFTEFNEKAYCVGGTCRNHQTQCKFLWGQTARSSNISCYKGNKMKNDFFKNCGVEVVEANQYDDPFMNSFTKGCSERDYFCGRLWCIHDNERIMQLGYSKTISFVNNEQDVCHGSRFELDWRFRDIGMVPDGAACGHNSLCLNAQCVHVGTVHHEDCLCSGNGVCDNSKRCHCLDDHLPPNCTHKRTMSNTFRPLIPMTSAGNDQKDSSRRSTLFHLASSTCKDVIPYIQTINSLKTGLILAGLVIILLLFLLLNQKGKLVKFYDFYVDHLKTPGSKFTDSISFKANFFKRKKKIDRLKTLPSNIRPPSGSDTLDDDHTIPLKSSKKKSSTASDTNCFNIENYMDDDLSD